MNYRMIGYTLSRILLVEAALLVLPLAVTLIYHETAAPAFLITMGGLGVAALLLGVKKPEQTDIFAREGFVIVALAWVLMSVFGALPFCISGGIPGFVDALFETVSGFTTTGSTILTDVEAMEHGLLFWRSFTHWVGGMGVLVFVMAVLPLADARSIHLMRAEMPGPTVGKLSSRARDTAKALYAIYLGMTVIEAIMLRLGGMSWFDSLIHTFGSAGTGGFSNRAASVGAYNSVYLDIVISVFVFLFGINFNLYYFALRGRIKESLKSEELRLYAGIVLVSTFAIAFNIRSIYGTVGNSLRYSFFQVSSVITTTGYATADFNTWPLFSKTLLVLLMFIGACAGSTGGGIKVGRLAMMVKLAAAEIKHLLHPHAVTGARFEERSIDEKTANGVHLYMALYLLVLGGATLLLSLDPAAGDGVTMFTSVVTCLNNIGPGLGRVGPAGNFAFYSGFSKVLLSIVMLIGRLEILPIILVFAPNVWSRSKKR